MFSPTNISLEELREATTTAWQECRSDPKIEEHLHPPRYGGCLVYCKGLRERSYTPKGIDYLVLRTIKPNDTITEHTFIAVNTTDMGIVIVDPTIQQIFPECSNFFIGTPEELADLINQNGGPDKCLGTSKTKVRDYYFNPIASESAFLSHIQKMPPRNQEQWIHQWDVLGPFSPRFDVEPYNFQMPVVVERKSYLALLKAAASKNHSDLNP